jgi:hypothetical protein
MTENLGFPGDWRDIRKMRAIKAIAIAGILAVPVILFARASGSPAGYTGAPASTIDHGDCTACHGGIAQTTGMSISGFGSGNTYTPGLLTHLTVTVPAGAAGTNHGFEFTARLASNTATSEGTLTDTNTTTQVLTGGVFITHTSAGNATNTFAFDWTPPPTNVGNIVFYAAGVSAFANVYKTSLTLAATGGSGLPTMTVSPASLPFAFQIGGTAPAAKSLSITSSGAAFSFTAAASGGTWLSATPASGTTPGGVSVSVNPSGLAAGTYNGSVAITSAGAGNSPQSVPVTLTVTVAGTPTLTITPTTLSFSVQSGGAAPPAQSISVGSSGSALNYTAAASGGTWLSATPASGTTPGSVSVSVNPAGLAAGTFNGSVTITSAGAGNSPRTVSVTLNVTTPTPPGSITASASSLTFNATVNGPAPPSQTLTVSAGSPTRFQATVSSGTSWLTISPSGSLTTNRNLTVSVHQSGLAVGTYSGRITLSWGEESRLRVTVTLNVTRAGAPTLTVSPPSLTFNYRIGGTAPAAQTLTVGGVATTFTASASPSGSWLSVSPTSGGTTSASVSVRTTGLAAATYSGSVTIAAAGSTGSPVTVPVTFNVTAAGPPTLTVSPPSLTFNYQIGGAAPAAQTLTVGGVATTFTASASPSGSWLSVSPTTGGTTSASVSVSTTGLAAAIYSGSVTITAAGSTGSPVTVPVTLNVTSGTTTAVTWTPNSLTFYGTLNSAAPTPRTLSVTAATATSFTVTASIQTGTGTWLSISPSGALTTPQTITASVSLGGLNVGAYNGTISIVAGGSTSIVPVTFVLGPARVVTANSYKLTGWNELGMHCDDGQDYSIFGVLPPYNSVHAHLIDSSGLLVKAGTGYIVTYQAITDPLTNTINTTSSPKTNFWQYVAALGLGSVLPDFGVTLDPAFPGSQMPGPANTPRAMKFATADNSFYAPAVPMMNYADAPAPPYPKNYFPMMRLTATNSAGVVVATTDIVLPISDEMSCILCHASNTGSPAAQPASGWVNNPNPAKDTKLNILRKHDDVFKTNPLFLAASASLGFSPSGLEAQSAIKPFLCAICHGSNALAMAGYTGVPALTTSMHGLHAGVINPGTGQTMENSTTRQACYFCHPGPVTQCMRGAMATLKAPGGANAIECQSCHGTMSTLAVPTRQGWLNEPACQQCHSGTATVNSGQIVYNSVFTSGTTVRVAADLTFATTPNVPAAGDSLFRFSSGHGGLQCEACHGSTHGEFPTPIINDNVESINLQGHVGVLAECASCHGSVPNTVTGGPHGMHPIGPSWVSTHQDVAEGNQATCQPCHGTDYRGTILSKTQSDEVLHGTSFPRGTIIGCYTCHNGPGGG